MRSRGRTLLQGLLMALALAAGCGEPSSVQGNAGAEQVNLVVDFASDGAKAARETACAVDFERGTRIGSGAEPMNASNLWSVTPYLVRIPSTGEGFVTLNVDAPHFDWLVYTTADVVIESLGGAAIERNDAVADCPERGLVEHGAHHHEIISWPLRLKGEPGARIPIYAALSPTAHSDLEHAGHAAHVFTGEAGDAGQAEHDTGN